MQNHCVVNRYFFSDGETILLCLTGVLPYRLYTPYQCPAMKIFSSQSFLEWCCISEAGTWGIYLLFIHERKEAEMASKTPNATLASSEVRSSSSLRIALSQTRLTEKNILGKRWHAATWTLFYSLHLVLIILRITTQNGVCFFTFKYWKLHRVKWFTVNDSISKIKCRLLLQIKCYLNSKFCQN